MLDIGELEKAIQIVKQCWDFVSPDKNYGWYETMSYHLSLIEP